MDKEKKPFINSDANVEYWQNRLATFTKTGTTSIGDEVVEHFEHKHTGQGFFKSFNSASGWNRIEIRCQGKNDFLLAAWKIEY